MRRREFVTIIGGAALWPLVTQAQQSKRLRRIGVIVPAVADDLVWQARVSAFIQGLATLGWNVGQNVEIETRWGTPNDGEIRKQAMAMAALSPDIILAGGSSTISPLMQATHTVPIVFTLGNDPVGGAGYVDSLTHPGGNVTGFMSYEFSIAGKWLALLKEITPTLVQVAVLRDTSQAFAMSMFAAIQAVAPLLGVEVIPINMRNAADIEQEIERFAGVPNGGLLPVSSAAAVRHRELIIALAARYKLPAVYWDRFFVTAGGLASYGPDLVEQFREAATYVDRILRGEKPGDLPVQASTKYQLIVNLKTAKSLGLDVPTTVLSRADELIE